jgi:fluoroacetyl-CoA thioesterase
MKATLKPGLKHTLTFTVTDQQTVPEFYPQSPMFRTMPRVFATGYMVGLFEWCCTELLNMHLDPGECSLGVHVDFSHLAATPPGMTVTVECECTAVDGKNAPWSIPTSSMRAWPTRPARRRQPDVKDRLRHRTMHRSPPFPLAGESWGGG